MYSFIYVYLYILCSLGIFAYPLMFLQLFSLTRMIMLIIKHRILKAKNEADKKETALLICYCILTPLLWLPMIILTLTVVL